MIQFIKWLLIKEEVKSVVKIIWPTIYHRFKAWLNYKLAKIDEDIQSKWESYAGWASDSTLDERDIRFSSIASQEDREIELPSRFILDNWFIQDQWKTNHCVWYGSTEWRNESNNFFTLPTMDVLATETVEYIRDNLDSQIDERGTYIYNWPKALKAMWKIHSYYRVTSVDDIKRSLYLGCTVQTGTNKVSWSKTHKNAVAVVWAGWGHHMNIVWYDDDMTRADWYGNVYTGFFVVENTWGTVYGDKWKYYLPYEKIDDILFNSRFAMVVDSEAVSKRSKTLIDNIEKELEEISYPSLELAIEEWLISSSELDRPVTRRELWIVAWRLLRKLK